MGGTFQADSYVNSAGTGAPNFPFGLTSINSAQLVGQATIGTASGWTTSNTSIGAFSAGTSASPVISVSNSNFNISTAASTLPQITVTNAIAGFYKIVMLADVVASASGRCGLAISDGTTTGDIATFFPTSGSQEGTLTLVQNFVYMTQANRTFSVYGLALGGPTLTLWAGGTNGRVLSCSIYYFPVG